MLLPRRPFTLLLFACALVVSAQSALRAADASAPIEKNDKTGAFQKKHQAYLERAKAGPIGLLFLGDSITDNWRKAPAVWDKYYGKFDPANFGIGGDTTQNVIWRIANGELDGIHPKVVVLMLGTNNTGSNTAAQIAAADAKIVKLIQEKIPGVKVLLLAIFPRGPRKGPDGVVNYADAKKRMDVINAVNPVLSSMDNGSTIRYLDLGAKFLGLDGKIPDAIMPDQLHPSAAGYQIWAEAMQPLLLEMMK